MCYNCGCFNPHDDMGSPDNITEDTFKHLAEHWNKSLEETKLTVFQMLQENKEDSHLIEMFEKAAKAWGQSVDETRKQTFNLLKSELKK